MSRPGALNVGVHQFAPNHNMLREVARRAKLFPKFTELHLRMFAGSGVSKRKLVEKPAQAAARKGFKGYGPELGKAGGWPTRNAVISGATPHGGWSMVENQRVNIPSGRRLGYPTYPMAKWGHTGPPPHAS